MLYSIFSNYLLKKCLTNLLKKIEYGYPHFNSLLQFCHTLEHCKQHIATCNPTKSDEINDIKLFFDSTSQDYTELPYLERLYSNQTHLTIILELATWTVLTFSNLNLVYKAPIRFIIKARQHTAVRRIHLQTPINNNYICHKNNLKNTGF